MENLETNPVQDAFATTLRRQRHKLDISQEELADRAKITMRYVSLLETGRRVPTIVVVFALAKGLEISAGEFVSEIENNISN